MNNPYPKQQSGTYKESLREALLQIGEEHIADAFQSGELKLAIRATITGAVKTHPEVTSKCVTALLLLDGNPSADYYRWGLQHGQFVVASTSGAFVYDPDDNKSAVFVKKMLKLYPDEISYFN
jgi:hypothetical protein